MAGRTPMLNKKMITDLAKGIERTTTIEMACAIVGISEGGFFKWQAIGRDLIEEYEVNGTEIPKEKQIYVDFVEAIERAKRMSCLPAIDTIQKAIKSGDVKAAEKLLSRRMPEAFGDFERKDVIIKGLDKEDTNTGIAVIPSLVADKTLDEILQSQQSDALSLAKSRTEELGK